MEVTVAVATFGAERWRALAHSRALPSAHAAGAAEVVHVHTDHDLAEARNAALALVRTEWVVYLDADDELEGGYLDAMAAGTADVRAPAVRYVHGGGAATTPRLPNVAGHTHACCADCLPNGNWLVIGSAVRADMLRAAGGWREFPWSEDWSVWLRCHLAGATFEPIPAAIYRAHVSKFSRNRGAPQATRLAAHRAILVDAGLGVEP